MIPIIIVGFAMMTLGVALLFLGEVPFVAGKRISAIRSRLIGAILLLYLPMALAATMACNLILGSGVVDGLVVTWALFGVVWFAVIVILFRVVVQKKERRPAKAATSSIAAAKNPFGDAEPIEEEPAEAVEWMEDEPAPAPKPAAKKAAVKPVSKKAPKAPVEESDPFDFS